LVVAFDEQNESIPDD
jgi:hypothetical protein